MANTNSFTKESLLIIRPIISTCLENHYSICLRCILRYCNVKAVFDYHNSEQLLKNFENHLVQIQNEDIFALLNKLQSNICQSCLNLLDDNFIKEKAEEIKISIGNKFRYESFQLHISLPVIFTLRNHYFQRKFNLKDVELISVKELFRVFLAESLQNSLQVKQKLNSTFIIELNFTHQLADTECEQLVQIYPEIFYRKKCRKSSATSFVNHSSILRAFMQLNEEELDQFKLLELNDCCSLTDILAKNEPVYIAGRYLKFSRVLSQTPWLIDGEKHFMSSVQERIFLGIDKYIQYKDIKFSSSGREDVDVQMLGKGRPFLIEIINPIMTLENEKDTIDKISEHINNSHQDVQVRDLQFVDKNQSQVFLKDGEQNKSKTYKALCCLSRRYTDEDFQILNSIENLRVTQKTPIRVLHRRTLSDRVRTIFKVKAEKVNPIELESRFKPFEDRIFNIYLTTEAGTYIKEFVHSDFGRTNPSLSSLLNISTDIINLDVLEINLDWPPPTE